ncbi:hypothetical protein GEV33_000340 [Tenebrio molitor]|uniref:Uncharacterized protein n=1 Tax=Tenebrio molitor TaxID=7067 RepID=A0A8J6HV01_TENMO|nr:hypothetical protein GEV33_000340 [Tenebrio molitor]
MAPVCLRWTSPIGKSGCRSGNMSDLKRLDTTRMKEEGWGKEEKKITFRQVTGTKGNRN